MNKIAFLFPGQGAQHVGMCKTIVKNSTAAKERFTQANEILGYDLASLCFEGPSEQLDSTVISQPALFVSSLAALELLRDETPDVVLSCEMTAGLSLGEYTALVFSGAMTFQDGLRVVQMRGQAMQDASDATPSGMVSLLLLDLDKVQKICRESRDFGSLSIANYLCPGNTVVSGDQTACEHAARLAEEKGGRAIPLPVAGAFHTHLMEPADRRLAEALSEVVIRKPEIPVVSNVDAQTHDDPGEIRDLLVRQVINPVRWEESIRGMIADGVTEFYEIGPGKVLKGLLKRIDRKIPCTTINDS